MVAEPNPSRRSDEDIARIVRLVAQGLLPQINRQYHNGRVEIVDEVKKVKFDEKYSRRMDKFTVAASQFRTWPFNLKVALGQIA
eukprot:10096235-Karenia_brevis.AAC.1